MHHHRTDRTIYDPNPLPEGVLTLPEAARDAGFMTFNAGKDDYNFGYDRERLYPGGYNCTFHWKESAADCDWGSLARSAPFFGQIQLFGGKRRHEEEIVELSPDKADVPLPPYYPEEEVFRTPLARHYGCIRKVDSEVEEIFKNLERCGVADNTVVFLFADHGWEGLRDKQFCYEGGLHVPLIVVGPESAGFKAGERRSELVSSLDISATTRSLCGIERPAVEDGRDLRGGAESRDHIVSQRDRCDMTLDCIRSVVSERYRYIKNDCPERPYLQPQYRSHWPDFKRWRELAALDGGASVSTSFAGDERPEEEFYDLREDPHQTRNLIESSELSSDIEQHREWLKAWREGVEDQGPVFPEGQLLAAVLRWGAEACEHPAYDAIKEKHADLIRRYPEQRPWMRDNGKSLLI